LGNLILIVPIKSGVYTCGLDKNNIITKFNITAESSLMSSKQEDDAKLLEFFSEWIVKIENFKTLLKESIYNCSSEV